MDYRINYPIAQIKTTRGQIRCFLFNRYSKMYLKLPEFESSTKRKPVKEVLLK